MYISTSMATLGMVAPGNSMLDDVLTFLAGSYSIMMGTPRVSVSPRDLMTPAEVGDCIRSGTSFTLGCWFHWLICLEVHAEDARVVHNWPSSVGFSLLLRLSSRGVTHKLR